MRKMRGFTLIELMVVAAIIAILVTLSVAGFDALARAGTTQSEVTAFVGTLQRARTQAQERQASIWVIVYPDFHRSPAALTGGRGAYFVYEDRSGRFSRTGGPCNSGERQFANSGCPFDPVTGNINTTGNEGRLLDQVYLDDKRGSAQSAVQFGLPSGTWTFGVPYTGLAPSECSFCASGNRGALVFQADGSARFIAGDGTPSLPSSFTTVSRSRSLAMTDGATRTYLIGVSGPASHIGLYPQF